MAESITTMQNKNLDSVAFAQATVSINRTLKPITEESARFLRDFFSVYKHKPIRAEYALRPNWRTSIKIAPDELIEAWRDENELVGVRPWEESNQLLLDIDPGSVHHPYQLAGKEDWQSIEGIRDVLFQLGIETKLFYSSERGGIHIRAFLPKMVKSLKLGAAIEYALKDAGYDLKNGQLELSPRIKEYSQAGEIIRLHQAFRLPMQRGGAYIGIGYEVEEREDGLDQLVEIIKANIEEHDMTILEAAMEEAYERLYKANREKFSQAFVRGNALEFKRSMELRMLRGFDGKGQTNELMKEALKYGYIFMHLSGQELVNWLIEAMETMPGYREYCGHQQEMERKAAAWQRWIERSHYYPYGSKNISESKAKAKAEGFVNGNVAKAESTKNKLKIVVRMVQKFHGTFKTAKEAIGHIRKVVAEQFTNMGTKFGGSTLNKPEYREIWEKLLEACARVRSRTFEKTPEISSEPNLQNHSPESISADHAPCSIECLGGGETERPKAGAVSPQLILGKMWVSEAEMAETVTRPEVLGSESTEEIISQPLEGNKSQSETSVLDDKQPVFCHEKELPEQIYIQQLNFLEIITNSNSAPSNQAIFNIWMGSYAQAKAVVERMSKEAVEPFNTAIYERQMLAERLRVFWAGVPHSWTDFARCWFERLDIDPGWPSLNG